MPGPNSAWQVLQGMDPVDVCQRAMVSYDKETRRYALSSMGHKFHIDLGAQQVVPSKPDTLPLWEHIRPYSEVLFPRYLAGSQDIPLSGKWVSPRSLKGGDFFARGTHALPLNRLARKYSPQLEAFLTRGKGLKAREIKFGDAAWQVDILPRVPVAIILWQSDEEFPPRAEVLFDASCTSHLPIDGLWAAAMACITLLL